MENIPIRMRVIYASIRVEFSTGYRIDAARWDAEKQCVKNSCTNRLKQSTSEINADLLVYYTDIQNIPKKFEVQNKTPLPEELKEAFASRIKQPGAEVDVIKERPKILLNVAFDEFIRECGNQNS